MNRNQTHGKDLSKTETDHGSLMDAPLDKPHVSNGQTTTLIKDMPAIKLVVKAYCDRYRMKWVLEFDDGKTVHVQRAVLNKVEFACKLVNGQRVGCGNKSEYRGFCHGSFDPLEKADGRKGHSLYFDREQGAFCDAKTGDEFFDAAKLILMADCHARYVKTEDKDEDE